MSDDGGPAFPNITPDMNIQGGPGMSLRDYFAGQALRDSMAALIAGGWANLNEYQLGQAAKAAYLAADAMLAARIPSLPGAMSGDTK